MDPAPPPRVKVSQDGKARHRAGTLPQAPVPGGHPCPEHGWPPCRRLTLSQQPPPCLASPSLGMGTRDAELGTCLPRHLLPLIHLPKWLLIHRLVRLLLSALANFPL